jgi:hypothetical protein
MAEKITSLNFNTNYDGHQEVIKLINEYASLRPAFSPTALIKDVLLEILPVKIAELERANDNK